MAQALWGREALADRTYGGKLAPKDRKNPDATVRKQMSPEKAALVIRKYSHALLKCNELYASFIDVCFLFRNSDTLGGRK
uniref:Uncharacterized protein n=1 Tax=Rhipicephalus zambeziensis TaxID=60191 RepID=A0A224YR70_9ACAR